MYFKCNQKERYDGHKRYLAQRGTKRSMVYSTNWMGIILTEDAVVLQKTMTTGRYVVFRLEFQDMSVFHYRKISKYKHLVRIRHHKKQLPSPFELMVFGCFNEKDNKQFVHVSERVNDPS